MKILIECEMSGKAGLLYSIKFKSYAIDGCAFDQHACEDNASQTKAHQ